jgi:indolepyruvate ferredoxin oxidoreductase
VINTAESPTADFVKNPNWSFGGGTMTQQVREAIGDDAHFTTVDATQLATALMGDGIYTNPFVMGFAWQKGWIPLAHESLMRAIALNGVAIEANQRAFEWGRATAHDLEAVKRMLAPAPVIELKRASTLEELVTRRVEFLTGYQNAAYAKRYSDLVERVRKVESDRLNGSTRLAEAVARYYFKLLAVKDEYEVARLHSDPAFREKIAAQFEGIDGQPFKLNFHLAPPLLAKPDAVTGKVKKITFGPWMMSAFGVLAKLKFLRGSALDVFGRTEERKVERALIGEYEQLVDEVLAKLTADNHAVAIELASIPEEIRGYGHVKERHLAAARTKWAALLARLRGQTPGQSAQVIPIPVRAA